MKTPSALFSALLFALLAATRALQAASGADRPPQAPQDPIARAQEEIIAACLLEPGTDAPACRCYVDHLKKTIAPADYRTAIELAAAAMRGDGERFREIVAQEGLSAERLQELITLTDRALSAAERRCEGDGGDSDGEDSDGGN